MFTSISAAKQNGRTRTNITPPSIINIPFNLFRPESGTGSALATGAIPLQEGQLFPGNLSEVTVNVAGVEKQVALLELEGRHNNGSLVSVKVQLSHSVSFGTEVAGEFIIGQAPTQARVAMQLEATAYPTKMPADHPTINVAANGVAGGDPTLVDGTHALHTLGFPTVILYCSSRAHIQACGLNEPVKDRASEIALGGQYASEVTLFESAMDNRFTQFSAPTFTVPGNHIGDMLYSVHYYDRPECCFQQFMRSMDPVYLRRGLCWAYNWMKGYGKTNDFRLQPYDQFTVGMTTAYWLTGYADYRDAVYQQASWNVGSLAFGQMVASRESISQDIRNIMRCNEAVLNAWRLGYTTITNRNGQTGLTYNTTDVLNDLIDKTLGVNTYNNNPMYQISGVWDGVWQQPIGSSCPGALTHFMIGMMGDMFIRLYRYYTQDSRIPAALKKMADWLYNNAYRPRLLALGSPLGSSAQEMLYLTNDSCIATEGPAVSSAAGDLHGLYLNLFGWLFQQGYGTIYRDVGDAIFGTARYFDNSSDTNAQKQVNQLWIQTMKYSTVRGL